MKSHMGLVVLVKKMQSSFILYCKMSILCQSCLTGLTNFTNYAVHIEDQGYFSTECEKFCLFSSRGQQNKGKTYQ